MRFSVHTRAFSRSAGGRFGALRHKARATWRCPFAVAFGSCILLPASSAQADASALLSKGEKKKNKNAEHDSHASQNHRAGRIRVSKLIGNKGHFVLPGE